MVEGDWEVKSYSACGSESVEGGGSSSTSSNCSISPAQVVVVEEEEEEEEDDDDDDDDAGWEFSIHIISTLDCSCLACISARW